MGFLFGTFRFLTWFNIGMLGLFIICIIILQVKQPGDNIVFSIFFILNGIHFFRCLKLHTRVKDPSFPTDPGFSTILIITGIYNLLYGMLIVFAFVAIVASPEKGTMLQLTGGVGNMQLYITLVIAFCCFFGLTIAINSILSFIFLGVWKKAVKENEALYMSFDMNQDGQ